MSITTKAEPDAYFEKLVAESMTEGLDRQKAEHAERTNLAYCAGYYSREIRTQVEELFRCQHPILGKAKDFDWTTDEVFGMGVTFAGLMAEDFPEHTKDARG